MHLDNRRLRTERHRVEPRAVGHGPGWTHRPDRDRGGAGRGIGRNVFAEGAVRVDAADAVGVGLGGDAVFLDADLVVPEAAVGAGDERPNLEPEARQLDVKERDGAVVGDPADLVGQVVGVQGRADVDAVLDEPHVAVASQGNGGGNVVGVGQREVVIRA